MDAVKKKKVRPCAPNLDIMNMNYQMPAGRIIPQKKTDLWAKGSNHVLDILSDSGLYLNHYQLNETASFIWNLCDGKLNAKEISEQLCRACEPNAPFFETVLSDVHEILRDLKEKKLLDWPAEKRCDILLVAPPFPSTYDIAVSGISEYAAPPLGLAYIAAYLNQHGFSADIADLHISGANPEDVIGVCRRKEPKLIGLTANTPIYPNALRTARYIKAWNPNVQIVLGGVHATGLPKECLEDGPFDFIVLGEGELTMLELSEHLLTCKKDPRDIDGIAYLDGDRNLVRTNPRMSVQNLDDLPFPDRELLDLQQYAKKGAICTSRGCPNNCTFCACNLIFGRKYRTPSIDYVIAELNHLKSAYDITDIDFNDDTFNWHSQRVFDLCEAMIENKLGLRWSCFCRAAQMTQEMAHVMKKAGCDAVQFGVESGSQEILKKTSKNTGLKEIEDAVMAVSKAGIDEIVCGIIIGHPQDTPETIEETYTFAEHLLRSGATRIMLSLLTPYPGTDAYINAEDLGIRFQTKDWEKYIFSRVVMETGNMPSGDLRSLYVNGLIRFLNLEKNSKRIWRAH